MQLVEWKPGSAIDQKKVASEKGERKCAKCADFKNKS